MSFSKPKISARLKAKYSKPPPPNGERLPDFVHATGNEYFRLDKPKPYAYVKCVGPTHADHEWRFIDPHSGQVADDRCARCGITREAYGKTTPFPSPAIGQGYPYETISEAQPRTDGCTPISWWACDPLGHWIPLTGVGHDVFEDEGGTITVSGVIENRGPYSPWWRGTITRGLWMGEAVSDPAPEADEET